MSISVKNVIFGIGGIILTEEEKLFFKEVNPLGFILFTRNCKEKVQIKELIASLKECLGREDLLILIDQEGGRVARLKSPILDKTPAASYFGDIAIRDGVDVAYKVTFENYLVIGKVLRELGINVDCAPVADIYFEDANIVIGDRSFGKDVRIITQLSKAAEEGLQQAKVQSIIKHIPGHGRAMKDSHHDLPLVEENLETLESCDFQVFKNLAKSSKMAMTAHIVYTALDADLPATLSTKVVQYIRNEIGFDGILITDALDMGALKSFGDLPRITEMAIDAGIDLILHCTGKIEEMREIAKSLIPIAYTLAAKIQTLNCFEIDGSLHTEL
jgi:beta-glucosidase-like glycosyl hydrolase